MCKLSDFDFYLPEELIAQNPLPERTSSKLLIIKDSQLSQGVFSNVANFFSAGDVLVINDTKVIKSRLFVEKSDHKIELFLHKHLEQNLWQAFAKPAKKVQIGDVFKFKENAIIVKEKLESGELILQLDLKDGSNVFDFFLSD